MRTEVRYKITRTIHLSHSIQLRVGQCQSSSRLHNFHNDFISICNDLFPNLRTSELLDIIDYSYRYQNCFEHWNIRRPNQIRQFRCLQILMDRNSYLFEFSIIIFYIIRRGVNNFEIPYWDAIQPFSWHFVRIYWFKVFKKVFW